MLGIHRLFNLLTGNMINLLGVVPHSTNPSPSSKPATGSDPSARVDVWACELPDLRAEALITVFGMDKEGRIKRERASEVVKQLKLMEEVSNEEEEVEPGIDLHVLEEELVHGNKVDVELLQQAFMVFDEDRDGFIDAKEIKRVLVCLGLDSGWSLTEIEEMIKAVDLNLDGKVDFQEFELMME